MKECSATPAMTDDWRSVAHPESLPRVSSRAGLGSLQPNALFSPLLTGLDDAPPVR